MKFGTVIGLIGLALFTHSTLGKTCPSGNELLGQSGPDRTPKSIIVTFTPTSEKVTRIQDRVAGYIEKRWTKRPRWLHITRRPGTLIISGPTYFVDLIWQGLSTHDVLKQFVALAPPAPAPLPKSIGKAIVVVKPVKPPSDTIPPILPVKFIVLSLQNPSMAKSAAPTLRQDLNDTLPKSRGEDPILQMGKFVLIVSPAQVLATVESHVRKLSGFQYLELFDSQDEAIRKLTAP